MKTKRNYTSKSLESRFWSKVEIPSNQKMCWEWKGSKDSNGYGRFYYNYRNVSAHRLAYELLKGVIPIGKELDHLCRNILCVNPDHLEAVEHRENILRGSGFAAQEARQTHCIHGHEFTKENTENRKNNKRRCRTCHREEELFRYYQKIKRLIQ